MPKITDLTTATPASDDVIPIVDVSDTTDSAAGSSRKCTRAALFSFGSTPAPATSGDIRLDSSTRTVISARNGANTADYPALVTSYDGVSGNKLFLGTNNTFTTQFGTLSLYCSSTLAMGLSGTTKVYVTSAGVGVFGDVNLGLYGGGSGFPSPGSGAGVFAMGNATTDPSTNPTGGGVLYASGGALKWRGSSGTVTTIAPAEPHCPRCGTDVGVTHAENDLFGEELMTCRSCELRTGHGVVRHVADFFDRRKAA